VGERERDRESERERERGRGGLTAMKSEIKFNAHLSLIIEMKSEHNNNDEVSIL